MGNETWLRVVLYRADNLDDLKAKAYMKASAQEVVEKLETQPGFQHGYWGYDQRTGTMAAVTYWDSRRAIEDAVAATLTGLHQEREQQGFRVHSEANVQLFQLPNHEQFT